MAEIRCPMCGKENPDHREVCQFCQARLKPLIASDKPGESPGSQEQSEAGSDLPGWLDFGSGDFSGVQDDRPFDEDTDDWLTRLAAGDESGEPAVPDPAEKQQRAAARMDFNDNGIPDWLEDFERDRATPAAEETPSDQPFDTDFPDWLSSEPDRKDAETPASSAEGSGDLPDWLFSDAQETPGLQEPASAEAESEIPDWLSGLEQKDETEPESIFSDQEPTPPFVGDDQDILSWMLDDEETASTETSATPEEEPDWLLKFGRQDTIPIQSSDSATGFDDLPEWLRDEEPEAERAAPAAGEGDLPAWLTEMEGVEPAESAPAFAAEETSDLPDWLHDEEPEAERAAPAAGEGDLPAWLTEMEGVEPAESAPAFAAEETSALPEWLRDEEPEAESAAPAADEGDLPAWLVGGEEDLSGSVSEGEEELPDWLAEMDGFAAPPEEEPAFPVADVDVEESRAVPDWLRGLEGPDQGADEFSFEEPAQATPVSPFVTDSEFEDDLLALDQLSDWGLEESTAGGASIHGAAVSSDEADLAPAELPGWLAAMRPIESSPADAQQGGRAENSGPLAGLYSILAAEPDILRLKKPPVYSSKLQVTDAQQTHAALLQGLLEAENKPQPMPLPALISGHRVFKAVLGALLLFVAFLAVLAGTQMTAMPQSIPTGVNQTNHLVSVLSPTDTVLLAFDYQPGLAGEMEVAAAAVVDHMMLRGVKLVLVSTSPTGPALAERFIEKVEGNHQYASGTQYVNLGYIPGGVSGLASFARNPQWVTPNTLDGVSAWQTGPLQNIGQLADLSVVLVLTDDPNTARSWIEQVGPQLGNTPMAAVVSAQVEPMIRPYADNQQAQLSGLVSGLTGGAAYEVMSRNNLARDYWDAFNIVLVVAVSAILIGSAITVVSDLMARRKGSGGQSA